MGNDNSKNKIFSSSIYSTTSELASHSNGSYFKKDRVNLLTKQITGDFNTYRNWKEFELALPNTGFNKDGFNVYSQNITGIKSLFNNYSAVYSQSKGSIREDYNIPLLDTPDNREKIRENTSCTIKILVDQSAAGKMGRAIYNYSDFMYCKHLGKLPNNHLITLRKFPSGCGDHINFSNLAEEAETNKHLPDLGRLVTWMGVDGNNMENILKYSYKLPWKDISSPMNAERNKEGGSSSVGKFISSLDGTYAKQVQQGYVSGGGTKGFSAKLGQAESSAPYTEGYGVYEDSNRVVSDLQNTIQKITVPGGLDGNGMEFTQDITLVFNYELRSYDGINPRSAMLDLLANILLVTYTQGKFFPGSYKPVMGHTTNAYANMNIFSDAAAGNIKSPADLVNSAWSSVTSLTKDLVGDDPVAAIKDMASNLFMGLVGNSVNSLGRPERFSMVSLISSAPTGQWHVTIGNPRNPILSIGNLILKDATIEHYGPLGLDDFPTGLKVTVQLSHGKPRDSVAIEQMYLHGDSRIYTPASENVMDMYKDATGYKSYTSTSIESTASDTYANSGQSGSDQASTASSMDSATDTYAQVSSSSVYNKLFGTTDTNSIVLASKESFIGAITSTKAESDPAKA